MTTFYGRVTCQRYAASEMKMRSSGDEASIEMTGWRAGADGPI